MSKNKRELIAEISEIRDIIASAKMGTWRIELVDGEEPRMFVDKTMKELLGIEENYIKRVSGQKRGLVPCEFYCYGKR